MRLYYLIGSLLLVAGCQDASNNKTNVDSTESTNPKTQYYTSPYDL